MEELQSYVREPDKYLVGTVGDRGSGKWQWHSCFDVTLVISEEQGQREVEDQ